MQPDLQSSGNSERGRTQWVLASITAAFVVLAVLFVADLWGRPPRLPKIPPVDPAFLDTKPWRQGYADLVKAKEDLSDFDCYACHEKSKPPVIKFDEQLRIILPKEHENIQLAHGSHNRNNVCYNCHNEQNLLTFQARDGRELKFQDSTALCGSCHGPTLRDFDAGVHGRTNGYWDRRQGPALRLDCVNCHDPHAPRIPSRAPAPPPHPLRPQHTSHLPDPH